MGRAWKKEGGNGNQESEAERRRQMMPMRRTRAGGTGDGMDGLGIGIADWGRAGFGFGVIEQVRSLFVHLLATNEMSMRKAAAAPHRRRHRINYPTRRNLHSVAVAVGPLE